MDFQDGSPVGFAGLCNMPPGKAGVYDKLHALGVNVEYVPSPKGDFSGVRKFLEAHRFDLVVLAGYMRVLPADIVEKYDILNIHPSLLPYKYKGSMDAYQDAIDSGDKITGCTVHRATTDVDDGPILGQIGFEIPSGILGAGDIDTLKGIGLAHEHALYPAIVRYILYSSALDIRIVADRAAQNIFDRGLPSAHTIIPSHGGTRFQGIAPNDYEYAVVEKTGKAR
jgi:phosphoribosylglycinamide formyltransferase-1